MVKNVCVLLAAYNGESHIKEQMSTNLFQKNVCVDLFVNLDFSSDRSLSIIQNLSDENECVHLFGFDKRFGSAGANFFYILKNIDLSKYDYIAFSDQDDIWFDDKLCHAIAVIEENNVDAYSSNVIAWWKQSGKKKLIKKSYAQTKYDYLFESAGPGCTFVFTQKLAIDIQNFLIDLGDDVASLWLHDWFCYAFARTRGYEWFIDPKPKMLYRQHYQNVVGANSGFEAFKKRVKEVVAGNAFAKVLNQAKILGLEDEKPIKLLLQRSVFSSLKLMLLAPLCRRAFGDKFLFAFAQFFYIFSWKKR